MTENNEDTMKKRYQISIVFEVNDEDDPDYDIDEFARRVEQECYTVVKDNGVNYKDIYEDMVWIVDEDGKCIGSL
jgi:hypothetical protein